MKRTFVPQYPALVLYKFVACFMSVHISSSKGFPNRCGHEIPNRKTKNPNR